MTDRTISTRAFEPIGEGRFRELLCGQNPKRAAYDQVLLEMHDCVVAPTLGSIVPNWLLIVPRRHTVSFRKWQTVTCINPARLVSEILAELKVEANRAIWFEHGPCAEGSLVGCGVDHAHLHLLIDAPFSFKQFAASAAENACVEWRRASSLVAYASISPGSSYLIAGSLDEVAIAEDVASVGSQFFRRIVAQLAGKPRQWNYKSYEHLENVRRTVSAFNHWSTQAAAS
jgi:ATP adenylyltransferase